jgi:predicted phage terminase large subunit-like protein
LYQQRPRIIGGHHLQREWFHIIDKTELPEGLRWRRFWDLAVKAKQSSDFTAGVRCAMDKDGVFYIYNIMKFKRNWFGAKRIIVNTAKAEKIPIGIETVSAFEIAMQEIKQPLYGIVPVRGYNVVKDKLTRAIPWIDLAENGKVILVDGPWIEDFFDEAEHFDPETDAYHDDQIDGVSGGFQMVKRAAHKPGLLI